MDIDTCDVFATVSEFKKHLCESGGTGLGEDVRPQAVRVIEEVDVGVKPFMSFGAFERVVGKIGEVALYGAFVGKYHIELI